MKRSLIAVAAAGLLGCGIAAAESFTLRIDGPRSAGFVAVQDFDNGWRRGYDDSRRFSVDERQASIHQRIQRGFARGDLTRSEFRQLERQLARIEGKERGYEHDGRLNRREQVDLHGDLDRVAQRLRVERRDGQVRY